MSSNKRPQVLNSLEDLKILVKIGEDESVILTSGDYTTHKDQPMTDSINPRDVQTIGTERIVITEDIIHLGDQEPLKSSNQEVLQDLLKKTSCAEEITEGNEDTAEYLNAYRYTLQRLLGLPTETTYVADYDQTVSILGVAVGAIEDHEYVTKEELIEIVTGRRSGTHSSCRFIMDGSAREVYVIFPKTANHKLAQIDVFGISGLHYGSNGDMATLVEFIAANLVERENRPDLGNMTKVMMSVRSFFGV